jgi:hydrogenase/urease accessory protein HupE
MIRHFVIAVDLLLVSLVATADVFRPAYLEIRELGDDEYAVFWKVPALGSERRLPAVVQLPDGARVVDEPRAVATGGNWVENLRIRYPGGLAGQAFSIEGSAVGVTEVIARVERLDGSSQVERLPMEQPRFVVEPPRGTGAVAWSYLVLGVEHILGGIDHLLFVLALLLIVRGTKRLIATVTAFTVAHSLTLAAATLGWVHVPGPPVEAIIALSIVFVASEVVHVGQGRSGLTERVPWVVAFSFGLLHGFGFAGALAEVGLPQTSIPLALLTFNLGVEIGQLIFVAVVLLLRELGTRFVSSNTDWLPTATAYGIGTVAAFWTVERIAGFWA